jgi:(1->4)-alpha-D-glucan 1-alpha-D-glucosylmutase
LNQVGGLFVNSENADEFTQIYFSFTGESTDYPAICRDKKHRVMRDLLGSDVNRLTSLLSEICECHRDRRDYTRHDILRAIREVIASLPVYRTYVVPNRNEITQEDESYVTQAIEASKVNRPDIDSELFDFVADLLLLRVRGAMESEFVFRFQQFTGSVMAKGVEDTAFYCFNRLISLNEVGGDPGRFGISPQALHGFCAEAQKSHPRTMLASSTHDTKRSEDVRARINVISEIPGKWRAAVDRWAGMNEKYKKEQVPDRNTEYFLYQTMIGAWPIPLERLLPYMEKACREAKQQTSWQAPNEAFEIGTREFIEALYKDTAFLEDFEAFVHALIKPGRINSLSQVLLKLTSPGIPDTYQGSEVWDLSLVDPDNRRPVDYGLRRRLLSELPNLNVDEVWQRIDEGLPKLWTIYHALRVRRNYASAFADKAAYQPLTAQGANADHLVAYMRNDEIIAIVPRLTLTLDSHWGNTSFQVPCGRWRNQLSGAVYNGSRFDVGEILAPFPVALLVKE